MPWEKSSATALMHAARRTRSRVLTERNLLLLVWLKSSGYEAHLEPPKRVDSMFPVVLCVHTPAGQLTWKLTEQELQDFAHLPVANDTHFDGATSDEKTERLRSLGEPENVAPVSTAAVLEGVSFKVLPLGPGQLIRLEQQAIDQLETKGKGRYDAFVDPRGERVRLKKALSSTALSALPEDRARRKVDRIDGWLYAGTLTKRA